MYANVGEYFEAIINHFLPHGPPDSNKKTKESPEDFDLRIALMKYSNSNALELPTIPLECMSIT
jgi:hypothetical protein